MNPTVDCKHLVERYTMSRRELFCLDAESVTLELPCEVLRRDHRRCKAAESILVCDIEHCGIIDCSTFVLGIERGQLHVPDRNFG
jgi:hypothetical protein